jgi:hypothetical protein
MSLQTPPRQSDQLGHGSAVRGPRPASAYRLRVDIVGLLVLLAAACSLIATFVFVLANAPATNPPESPSSALPAQALPPVRDQWYLDERAAQMTSLDDRSRDSQLPSLADCQPSSSVS